MKPHTWLTGAWSWSALSNQELFKLGGLFRNRTPLIGVFALTATLGGGWSDAEGRATAMR